MGGYRDWCMVCRDRTDHVGTKRDGFYCTVCEPERANPIPPPPCAETHDLFPSDEEAA